MSEETQQTSGEVAEAPSAAPVVVDPPAQAEAAPAAAEAAPDAAVPADAPAQEKHQGQGERRDPRPPRPPRPPRENQPQKQAQGGGGPQGQQNRPPRENRPEGGGRPESGGRPEGNRPEGRPGGGRPERGPDRGGDRDRGRGDQRRFGDFNADIELERLIADSLYLDNAAHAVAARMHDMDSATKSHLRRFYNGVRRACRAAENERQHEFVMLRARLAYTIARHSLRSLDSLEKLLLQVTRRNDAKGYERFKDLFEAIIAYNE